jgi:hypothetical protein
MGRFIDQRKQPEPEPERKTKRKHPQTWPGLWDVGPDDFDRLSKAVEAASDRYTFVVTDPVPGQPANVVSGTCTYTARGANKTDVARHIFTENGIEPLLLELDRRSGGVKMLCGCRSQEDSCTDDNDYWP